MKFEKTIFFISFILIFSITNAQVRRAIIVPSMIDSIICYNERFLENDSLEAPVGYSWFEYRLGKGNILIVAGHATAHIRENRIKQPDSGTVAIAVFLNKTISIPSIYTTYISPSDPNFYDNNAFKDSLAIIIDKIKPTFVIDLHTANAYRPFDLDFGTMEGTSFLNRQDLYEALKKTFFSEGLINQSQDFFAAKTNRTITKFVSNKGIPCIQVEINSNYLNPHLGGVYAQNTAKLIQALVRFVENESDNSQ